MKKVLLLSIFLDFLVHACLFQFTNDTNNIVFIADDMGKGVVISPGEKKMLDPAKSGIWKYLAKEKVYIYIENALQNNFNLRCRLVDDYCTEDEKENEIKISEILGTAKKITKRFRVKKY